MMMNHVPDRHMDMVRRAQLQFVDSLPAGNFFGSFSLEWCGPNRFRYMPGAVPFGFRRANGVLIVPEAMETDGGSIPRPLWSLPGLSPWDFGPAYLIHDWEFTARRAGLEGQSFEECSLTLAEGIVTLMKRGYHGHTAPFDRIHVHTIYTAVSGSIGRRLWNRRG
jgi:hypothetical protein